MDDWARHWLREQLDTAEQARQTTTTYNVGGVPLSVTGSHVAFMVVPTPPATADQAEDEA